LLQLFMERFYLYLTFSFCRWIRNRDRDWENLFFSVQYVLSLLLLTILLLISFLIVSDFTRPKLWMEIKKVPILSLPFNCGMKILALVSDLTLPTHSHFCCYFSFWFVWILFLFRVVNIMKKWLELRHIELLADEEWRELYNIFLETFNKNEVQKQWAAFLRKRLVSILCFFLSILSFY
jgi:hypothetical protein